MNSSSLSRGLAYFSLGLGFAELFAPRRVARLAGLNENHDNLIRGLGLGDLLTGLGLLQGKTSYVLPARVAGDAVVLALLAAARRSPANDRRRVDVALAAVAGVTALDVIATLLARRDPVEPGWRVRDEHDYTSGLAGPETGAPGSANDDVMSGRAETAFAYEDDQAFERLPPGQSLDELAGYDDGLEETDRNGGPSRFEPLS